MSDVKQNVAGMIQACEMMNDLNQADCEIMSSIVDVCELSDNEVLFSEGESDNRVYIIGEGRLAVSKGGEANTTILHVLETGHLAGEMAFVDQTPHSATLRALGNTTVLSLDREKFEGLIDVHPQLVYHVMRAIVRGVHTTLKRMNLQYVEMSNYISQMHGRY